MSVSYRIPLIDLRAQYLSIRDEIDEAISRVLNRGNYVMGEEVAAFEEEFAHLCQARYCVAVGSGTEALYLALTCCADTRTAGVRLVLTTPLTFYATTQAILRAGDHPFWVDIGDDGNIDIAKCDYRWDIALPVHLYGQPARIPPKCIKPIIEDSAQAHGCRLKGMVACFSFYPTKNLGAMGQAGALVTNDTNIANTARRLREYGETERFVYDHEPWRLGGNFRMDELQAAILRAKLPHLNEWNYKRQQIACHYKMRLKQYEDVLRIPPASLEHVYHIFAILVKDRDSLAEYLRNRHIQTAVRYPVPIHLQPALRYLAMKKGDFPKAEKWCQEVLTLPIYPEMDSATVDEVCEAVIGWARKQRRH